MAYHEKPTDCSPFLAMDFPFQLIVLLGCPQKDNASSVFLGGVGNTVMNSTTDRRIRMDIVISLREPLEEGGGWISFISVLGKGQ